MILIEIVKITYQMRLQQYIRKLTRKIYKAYFAPLSLRACCLCLSTMEAYLRPSGAREMRIRPWASPFSGLNRCCEQSVIKWMYLSRSIFLGALCRVCLFRLVRAFVIVLDYHFNNWLLNKYTASQTHFKLNANNIIWFL